MNYSTAKTNSKYYHNTQNREWWKEITSIVKINNHYFYWHTAIQWESVMGKKYIAYFVQKLNQIPQVNRHMSIFQTSVSLGLVTIY